MIKMELQQNLLIALQNMLVVALLAPSQVELQVSFFKWKVSRWLLIQQWLRYIINFFNFF